MLFSGGGGGAFNSDLSEVDGLGVGVGDGWGEVSSVSSSLGDSVLSSGGGDSAMNNPLCLTRRINKLATNAVARLSLSKLNSESSVSIST